MNTRKLASHFALVASVAGLCALGSPQTAADIDQQYKGMSFSSLVLWTVSSLYDNTLSIWDGFTRTSMADSQQTESDETVTDNSTHRQEEQTENPFLLLVQYDNQTVFLMTDKKHLVGCHSASGRFREIKLLNEERLLKSLTGEIVAVAITNRRYLGYSGTTNRWYIENGRSGEKFQDLQVSSSSAVVLTSRRIMTFNGRRWNVRNR